jgi:hypothetical protein
MFNCFFGSTDLVRNVDVRLNCKFISKLHLPKLPRSTLKFQNMSFAKNVSSSAQPSQDTILLAHNALMAALDTLKECLAAAGPLEVARLDKDTAARDERFELSKKIGSILVCNVGVLDLNLILLMYCSLKSLGHMGRLPCTSLPSSCRL